MNIYGRGLFNAKCKFLCRISFSFPLPIPFPIQCAFITKFEFPWGKTPFFYFRFWPFELGKFCFSFIILKNCCKSCNKMQIIMMQIIMMQIIVFSKLNMTHNVLLVKNPPFASPFLPTIKVRSLWLKRHAIPPQFCNFRGYPLSLQVFLAFKCSCVILKGRWEERTIQRISQSYNPKLSIWKRRDIQIEIHLFSCWAPTPRNPDY